MTIRTQFSLAMAFGNVFIYSLQRYYGALVVTTTTTLRKFLSVLASALPKEVRRCRRRKPPASVKKRMTFCRTLCHTLSLKPVTWGNCQGICVWVPLLPQGVCGLAAFPGCAVLSCASISGYGNEIVTVQWCVCFLTSQRCSLSLHFVARMLLRSATSIFCVHAARIGVALVVLSKNISNIVCNLISPDTTKNKAKKVLIAKEA